MTIQERKIKTIMFVNFLFISKTMNRKGKNPIVFILPNIGEFHIGTKAAEKKKREVFMKHYNKSVRKKGKSLAANTTDLKYIFSTQNNLTLGHKFYSKKNDSQLPK